MCFILIIITIRSEIWIISQSRFRLRSWNNSIRSMSCYDLTGDVAYPHWFPIMCIRDYACLNVPFFDFHSWTVPTPAKYERDIQWITSVFVNFGNWENEIKTNRNIRSSTLTTIIQNWGFWMTEAVRLFSKWTDVSPHDLVKSRSREIRVYTFPIALIFYKHLRSIAAEMPVKFQSDAIIITSNLAASRLHDTWR